MKWEHKPLPSQERLQDLFNYEPITGTFQNAITGRILGGTHRLVGIDGKLYFIHRVIWKMMTNVDPGPFVIDHIDGTNNTAFSNLRLCTQQQNMQNRKNNCRQVEKNTPKGVHKNRSGSFVATCQGKYIGSFPTSEKAHSAYCEKAKEVFGEYARFE